MSHSQSCEGALRATSAKLTRRAFGGPSVVVPDGGEQDTVLTGKVFGSVAASEKLSVYGELSAAFDDTNSYGTKAGLKYSF